MKSSQGIFPGAEMFGRYSSQSFTLNIWYQLTVHVHITLCITSWSTYSETLCQPKSAWSSKRNGKEWREAFYFWKFQNKGEIWVSKRMEDSKKAFHGKIFVWFVHISVSVNWILKGKILMYLRFYYILVVKKNAWWNAQLEDLTQCKSRKRCATLDLHWVLEIFYMTDTQWWTFPCQFKVG